MSTCPECGAQTQTGARFCGQCRASLDNAPDTWGLGSMEFARVYEVADVPGWFTKPLAIKANQQALIFVQGKFEGIIPGGVVDMGGLKSRILSLGRTKSMQAVVISESPVGLIFTMPSIRTSDGLTVEAEVSVGVQVSNPMTFFRTAIGNARVYDVPMLKRVLFGPTQQAAVSALARMQTEEIRRNPDRLIDVEREVARQLQGRLSGLGLTVSGIAVAQLKHEGLDLLDQRREQRMISKLLTDEEIAEEEEKYAQDRQRAAQQLRRDEAEQVDDEGLRVDIREKVRRLLLKDRTAEVRITEDEQEFLSEVAKQRLLRADELEAVKRALEEKNEDHEIDRQHALDLLTMRQAHEILEGRSGLQVAEIEAQIRVMQVDLERMGILQSGEQELQLRDLNHRIIAQMKISEAEIDEDRRRYEAALEKRQKVHVAGLDEQLSQAKTDAEVRRIEQELDQAEMEWLMALKERKDFHKLVVLEREQLLEDVAADRDLDRHIRLLDTEHSHKMELVDKMAGMSLEQLMAMVEDSDRAAILADVKKMEITAGMTEEQILAASAKDAPHVAEAIRTRFEALAETKSAREVQAMMDKMVEAEKDHSRQVQEVYERNADRAAQQADKALEVMRDVAAAAAGGGGGTTVVMPTGQVIGTGRGGIQQSGAMVVCSHCRSEVPAGEKFCGNCGEKV